ncbi:uncharacterized protein LOC131892427 [Tigriopus californicus]|uniref:uncharacterized protein LOC131892427 n=1 Tax=Tigriopus californicus TaxID=6832 RepID=UPI0027DA28DA|nr:uncharacterized protein LOC131892427 [Tigriopus californicus]
MFFSTKAAPPFTGFREIVQAYPNWVLKTLAGTDIVFYDRAESGDPDFKAFYERMVENPEETTFTDTAHVLKEMDTNYIGIMANTHSLQYAFETNLDLTTPLEILETLNEAWYNVILTKNSPLSPMIRRGINSLRDNALLERASTKWLGFRRSEATETSAMAVGVGHTLLVYIIMTFACVLSLTFLGMEHLYAKIFS